MKERKAFFESMLSHARDFPEVFEVVKLAVLETIGKERSGLMLALTELGVSNEGYIGAYYPVDSNVIVMNKTPLRRIEKRRPDILNEYVFHILLHEYLHALGVLDEAQTRSLAYSISEQVFGPEHVVTKIAANITAVIPEVVYPEGEHDIPGHFEIVRGFDSSSMGYIG